MKLMERALKSLLLSAVCLAGSAYAQVTASVIKVNIPFEFRVGEKTFAPGDYSVIQPLQHYFVLRDARGHTVTSALTNEVDASAVTAAPKLRFVSVNGQQELIEFWQNGQPFGQRLIVPKSHVSMAKQRAADTRERSGGNTP